MSREDIDRLLQRAAPRPDCSMLPPAGPPQLPEGLTLPSDVAAFYERCGGLYFDWNIPIGIVGPHRFVPANPVMFDEPVEDDISARWFIVAEADESRPVERITMDLDPARLGRCYNSFWDRHAMPGSSKIVARSFTELLTRLIDFPGEDGEPLPYWHGDDFESLGDAYDDV